MWEGEACGRGVVWEGWCGRGEACGRGGETCGRGERGAGCVFLKQNKKAEVIIGPAEPVCTGRVPPVGPAEPVCTGRVPPVPGT